VCFSERILKKFRGSSAQSLQNGARDLNDGRWLKMIVLPVWVLNILNCERPFGTHE
jgi:hypothetical protein